MNSELWTPGGGLCEGVSGGVHHVVYGDGHVITANLIGQAPGPVAGLVGGVGTSHVAGGEESSGEGGVKKDTTMKWRSSHTFLT